MTIACKNPNSPSTKEGTTAAEPAGTYTWLHSVLQATSLTAVKVQDSHAAKGSASTTNA